MSEEDPSATGSQRAVYLHSIIANNNELIVHDKLMTCDRIEESFMTSGKEPID